MKEAALVLCGFVVGCLVASSRGGGGGERSRPSSSERSFVLLVDATFGSVEERDLALKLWQPVAEHCRNNEPETLSYEAAISDSDANRIVFVERYETKEKSYLEVHRSSDAFLKFRKQLSDMAPQISGHSYLTTDIGYFS